MNNRRCRIALVLVITVFVLAPFGSIGQESVNRPWVSRNESVDRLVNAWLEENDKNGMRGFRVQIFTASGNRSKMITDRQRAEFHTSFPNVRSYIVYEEPYYKLRVGNFRTRLDAQRFLETVSGMYVYAIVVPDRINPPSLSEEDFLMPDNSNDETHDQN